MEYDNVWDSFNSRQAGKYKDDPELEEHYLLAVEETTSSIDLIWDVLSSNSNQTVNYSGEENIDTEFNKLLSARSKTRRKGDAV